MKNKSKKDFIYSVGRRKGASARVRLYLGKGESTVNGKNIEKYFGTTVLKDLWSKPLRLIDGMNTYYVGNVIHNIQDTPGVPNNPNDPNWYSGITIRGGRNHYCKEKLLIRLLLHEL